MILFGTNPIAWSNDDDPTLGADISLERCLDEAAQIGFDGIEKGHKFPTDADGLKAVLAPRRLRLVSWWHSTNLLVNDVATEIAAMRPVLQLLKAMGSQIIIVCETSNAIHGRDDLALADRPVLTEPEWPAFTAAVEALAEAAAAEGITLVYHHHMGTVVQSEDEIDRLMQGTGPATKLLLDTGHCWFGGGDPERVARTHMARVGHIHCKNVRPEIARQVDGERLSFLEGVRRGVFTVPGDPEGVVAFAPVLRIAADHAYSGWVVIEAEQDAAVREPRHYQSLGLRSLRRIAEETGLTPPARAGR